VRPTGHGFAIGRQGLQFTKRSIMPIYRTKDNRDDASLASIMPLHRSRHLLTVAVLRGHKSRADEEQNELSSVEMERNCLLPICSCTDFTIMPDANELLSLQQSELF